MRLPPGEVARCAMSNAVTKAGLSECGIVPMACAWRFPCCQSDAGNDLGRHLRSLDRQQALKDRKPQALRFGFCCCHGSPLMCYDDDTKGYRNSCARILPLHEPSLKWPWARAHRHRAEPEPHLSSTKLMLSSAHCYLRGCGREEDRKPVYFRATGR